MTRPSCPRCGGWLVCRSSRRNRSRQIRYFRCRDCGHHVRQTVDRSEIDAAAERGDFTDFLVREPRERTPPWPMT